MLSAWQSLETSKKSPYLNNLLQPVAINQAGRYQKNTPTNKKIYLRSHRCAGDPRTATQWSIAHALTRLRKTTTSKTNIIAVNSA